MSVNLNETRTKLWSLDSWVRASVQLQLARGQHLSKLVQGRTRSDLLRSEPWPMSLTEVISYHKSNCCTWWVAVCCVWRAKHGRSVLSGHNVTADWCIHYTNKHTFLFVTAPLKACIMRHHCSLRTRTKGDFMLSCYFHTETNMKVSSHKMHHKHAINQVYDGISMRSQQDSKLNPQKCTYTATQGQIEHNHTMSATVLCMLQAFSDAVCAQDKSWLCLWFSCSFELLQGVYTTFLLFLKWRSIWHETPDDDDEQEDDDEDDDDGSYFRQN